MPRRFWTEAELRTLRELFPTRRTPDVAQLLGCKISRVTAMASKLGLKKRPEACGWLKKGQSQPGTEGGRFQKGIIPANKGLRRPGYSVGRGRMQETQFKKGERTGAAARNWKPVGTITTDPEGYLRIKVREAVSGEHSGYGNTKVWPLYGRYTWEQHNGPIPSRHLVRFKDGNKQNCAIENLELLSMADNARRNSMWAQLPRELALAIQMNGQLKRKIRRLNGKEQDQRSA